MTELLVAHPGKFRRLPTLFDSGCWPLIWAPVDDHLLFGPFGGLEHLPERIDTLAKAGVNAILTHVGIVRRFPTLFAHTPVIVNLSASTTQSHHTRKTLVADIEDAVAVNAEAVAVHINLGSKWAPEMLNQAGTVVSQAQRFGLPVVGIIYPRSETIHHSGASPTDENFESLRRQSPKAYADLVAQCAAVGAGLGFDAIKTQFAGPRSEFARVIVAACGVPVLIAGGPLRDETSVLSDVRDATAVGAAGVSFGRNLFGRESPQSIIASIRMEGLRENR